MDLQCNLLPKHSRKAQPLYLSFEIFFPISLPKRFRSSSLLRPCFAAHALVRAQMQAHLIVVGFPVSRRTVQRRRVAYGFSRRVFFGETASRVNFGRWRI